MRRSVRIGSLVMNAIRALCAPIPMAVILHLEIVAGDRINICSA